jgi:CheY-like chemotaxis protein
MKELEGKRVLVVDDNKTNRIILQKQLAEWHMQTVLACSGKEALALIGSEAAFDLVITDMQMPEMDGIDLATEIRNLNAHLPIVLLSSVGDIRSKDLNHLFNSTITKPIRQHSLLDHIIPALTSGTVQVKSSKDVAQTASARLSVLYPLSILVAEDNIINQLLAQKMLATLGYEPVVVHNGREAVDRFKEEYFDLILMDVQMPVMDGFEATKEIRLLQGTQPVIIATTANAMQGDEAECRDAGMDDYLSKPIKIEALRKIILHWGRECRMRSVG